jgi:hypothetical protein
MMRFTPHIFTAACFLLAGLTGYAAPTGAVAVKMTIEPGREASGQNPPLFAESRHGGEPQNASDIVKSDNVKQNGRTKTPQPAPAPKRKADPIKPFKPSEKVKADQTVDFPYDI